MAMPYRMEIVEDIEEGGFVVSYPDLPGCITCGETVESAVTNALDAKKAWFEASLEAGIEIHEPYNHQASSSFLASLSTICLTISTYTFLIGSCFGIVIGIQSCFLNVFNKLTINGKR